MTIFTSISLAAFVIAVTLGSYVLARNPRERLNQIFFAFSISGAYWAFTEFCFRQADTLPLAMFWIQVSAFWVFTPAFELHFMLLFVEKKRWLESRLTYVLIYGPAVLFALALLLSFQPITPDKVHWGWNFHDHVNLPVASAVSIWMILLGLLSILLTIQAYRHSRTIQRKRQIILVSIGLVTTYLIGFISNALPGFMGIVIPDFSTLGFILECLFFAIAIWWYSLFDLTPASAAEQIIGTMQDALFLVNPEGVIVNSNQAGANLLGVDSPGALLGMSATQFLAESELQRFEEAWLPRLQKNGFIKDEEAAFCTIDGTERIVSLSASILRREEGQAQGVVYVVHDLSARKQEEQEKREMEKQMHQAQKLESLGILTKGIAHDFNNLLMIIIGNTDIALHHLPDDSPAVASIKRIKQNALRSSDLVRQMLTYSGKGKFVLEPVALNTVIKDMQDLLASSISKKARLDYDLIKPLPIVEADLTQVRQIILNLVTNASEALADQSGTITVQTTRQTLSKSDLLKMSIRTAAEAGPYVVLSVSDTGQGIPQSELSKIFDPFYSTKFPGRGLGLSAVLGIVQEHKGFINVHSEPESGTRIDVGFALVDEGEVETMAETPQPETWRSEGTLLVVDDEEEVLDVARQLLELIGFKVLVANGGREALDIYRANREEIRFVVLDLTMPEMDGRETAYHLREMDPDVKLIIASGYDEMEIRERFTGQELVGVIQKPFQFAELQRQFQTFSSSV